MDNTQLNPPSTDDTDQVESPPSKRRRIENSDLTSKIEEMVSEYNF